MALLSACFSSKWVQECPGRRSKVVGENDPGFGLDHGPLSHRSIWGAARSAGGTFEEEVQTGRGTSCEVGGIVEPKNALTNTCFMFWRFGFDFDVWNIEDIHVEKHQNPMVYHHFPCSNLTIFRPNVVPPKTCPAARIKRMNHREAREAPRARRALEPLNPLGDGENPMVQTAPWGLCQGKGLAKTCKNCGALAKMGIGFT